VISHQHIFQTFGFPESQDGWFFEDFEFWGFLYGCLLLTNDIGKITERRMVCDGQWHSVVRVLCFILDEFVSINTTFVDKTMITVSMTFQFPKTFCW
jgi:hypothetical protein